ncbi:MAG: protein BatD [Planctomycetes bacterium]|nr:protein BatD [Planctomycetota bacterium]
MIRRGRAIVVALVLALGSSSAASAAEVRVSVSSRRVYADVPFTLQIQINHAKSHETPELPEMDGIRVIGEPRETNPFQPTIIINGREIQNESTTITWPLLAERTGKVTIPPITVRADGRSFVSEPISVVSVKPDAGNLLFVEIDADRETVYLGERVDLTLRLWIKPFHDPQYQIVLNGESMFSLVSIDGSNWGAFEQTVRELTGPRRQVSGVERTRRLDDGTDEEYYVFELTTSFVPRRTGALDIDPVAVRMRYPKSLRRSRGIFSRSNFDIADQRVIAQAATPPALVVQAPPTEGRPPEYNGAVGRFDIDVGAHPRSVAVGDPITLTITIRDRTSGAGRLDVLSPPALERLDDLNEAFRVPDEPLAGVVDGQSKTFTQTIRARRPDVTRIPSIPFAFFDPEAEAYAIARSEPIGLTVEATTEVGMADVIGADGGAVRPAATGLTESAAGLLANEADVARLLARQGFVPRWWHLLPVAAPPLLYLAVLAGHWHTRRLRDDHGYARRRGARRTASRRLADAARATDGGGAEAVASALSGYIADRCNVPSGSLTAAEAAGRLHHGAVDADLAGEVEQLLSECEHARYAGGVATDPAALMRRAEGCIARLERERLP